MVSSTNYAIGGTIAVVILCTAVYRLLSSLYGDAGGTGSYMVAPDRRIRNATVENFLLEIAHEKPIRFSPRQLKGFTRNYSTRLGAGGFGAVFRGVLPNGLPVAVKVLHAGLGARAEQEQFMAEVGTIGRTHHINLFMEHGALDAFLLGDRGRDVGVAALRDVAVGVARGIRYLHEECQQKVDANLTPKVADFGLTRLVNRADTHMSVSCMRGTPGYAAPEMWMMAGVTEKCDVYSFGMLLLEIVGRRRGFDGAAPESQQWLPKLAWAKYEAAKLMDLVVSSRGVVPAAGGGEQERQQRDDEEIVERMCKVAFWCVQQQPEARPPMSVVVKMLEGEMEIAPPANPFQHLMAAPPLTFNLWTTTATSAPANIPLASGVSEGSNRIVSL
ncbi:unnamed protein product [Urochloa decumbens]|uniref:Protein kinase domain-containing protein n=1 Tax=Urochloa decumbens TaxID=240449 RepID=A0ABC9GBX6_9POAL